MVGAEEDAAAAALSEALARDLHRAPTVAAACSVVVDYLLRVGMTLPSLYLERGGRLRCQAVRGYWQVFDGMPVGAGVIGSVFRSGRATEIRGVVHRPDYLAATLAVVDEVCVPISAAGRVVGALNVESTTALPADALAVTRAAAAAFGDRLTDFGGASPESPAQRLARHATIIADAPTSPQLWAAACVAAREMTGSSSAAVVLGVLEDHTVACGDGPLTEQLASASADVLASIAGWVSSGSSCWTLNDPDGFGFPGSETLRTAGAAAVLVVPLGNPSGLATEPGFLLIADEAPSALATDLVELLELLGTHISSCARTLRSLEVLRRQAGRDQLTDLSHHAAYHEAVAAAVGGDATTKHAASTADPGHIAVVMLDLDDFKLVNDLQGHPAGDALLRSAARLLSAGLREGEELYRVGGDEFATLLRVGTAGEALGVAERLRATAAAELGTTISVGVALAGPDEPVTSLIARADSALYEIKRSGRDGVRLAPRHRAPRIPQVPDPPAAA